MGGQIFISYRRDDSSASAGRIYDRLTAKYPRNQIFMDVDSLEPGVDFVDAIETSVGSCDVLIAVIGKRWLAASDEQGKHRLDNPDDFVRLEIATALKRRIRVIPVLVDGALMPRLIDLPDDLKRLVRRNALEVSHNRFDTDLARLTAAIERVLEEADAEPKPPPEQRRPEARQRQREEREHVTAAKRQRGLEGPVPVVKVQFGIRDPHGSEAYKVVYVRVFLENAGQISVRNPKVTVHYSEPGIVHLKENSVWSRVIGTGGLYPLNPRILEANITIRPAERVEILPIQYPLSRFQQAGIHCETLMDDESPVQSGVTVSANEVPESGWKEKLGEENFFPVLTPCPTDPDPNQRLSPIARDVLNRIVSSEGTNEGKGVIVIRGFPSNNETIACVFSLRGGTTLGYPRNEFESALEELILTGFIMELDRENKQIRYKLIGIT